MLNLNAGEFPALKELITTFQQWDRKAVTSSKGAAIFLLVYHHVAAKLRGTPSRQLTKKEAMDAYQDAYDHLMKHFGSTDLTLGDIQKLVRGEEALPAWGLPDVLTSAYTEPYIDGKRKVVSGDAYICFVRYPKNGLPIIESVNTFGASSDPASKHYKDQLAMFQNQQTKPMTLDKQEVLKKASRIYHPGE
jgi:acyl-homoserine-lactone acylase